MRFVGRSWNVAATAVERTIVRWLWRGRIPLGAITLLDGDPERHSLLTAIADYAIANFRRDSENDDRRHRGGTLFIVSAHINFSEAAY